MKNGLKRLYQKNGPVWVSDEIKTILTNTPENGVIIDAGCHKGAWIQIIKEFIPRKYISIGIDPIDHIVERITPPFKVNIGYLYDYFFNYAIDIVEGIRDFHIFKESGCNSLFKSSKEIDEFNLWYLKECEIVKKETRTLESLLKENNIGEIYFLKVDCQGNDVNVVKSLKSYINKVQYIQIESNIDKKLPTYDCDGSFKEDIIEIEKLGFKAIYYVVWEVDGMPVPSIECEILFKKL